MRAKERHKNNLLKYLANPDNEFLNRCRWGSGILGISTATLYEHFTPAEMAEIEDEALIRRRKRYSSNLARVDRALLSRAIEGDAVAARLVYQRFEGWSVKRQETIEVKQTVRDLLDEIVKPGSIEVKTEGTNKI